MLACPDAGQDNRLAWAKEKGPANFRGKSAGPGESATQGRGPIPVATQGGGRRGMPLRASTNLECAKARKVALAGARSREWLAGIHVRTTFADRSRVFWAGQSNLRHNVLTGMLAEECFAQGSRHVTGQAGARGNNAK